jgi:hypothetical protein
MEDMIFKMIDAGGSLALFGLVAGLWKLDRRLVILETTLKHMLISFKLGEHKE